MDLSVSIVNYNGCKLLRQCLESVYKETRGIEFDVYVVDNASVDDSMDMVKKEFPQVKVIRNNENLFFAKAHNKALKIAGGRYSCVLNNDTVILDNALGKLVKFMDEHPEAGACGPRLTNADGTLQRSCSRFPTFMYGLFQGFLINTVFPNNFSKKWKDYSDWGQDSLRSVDSVSGSCIVVRSGLRDNVGLLDEGFLIYWEEIDWCYRICKAGWKVYYVPDSQIIHYWGVAMKKHGITRTERIYQNSMKYYYRKHFGIAAYLIISVSLYMSNIILLGVRHLRALKTA
jgi:GT2 family glycosyltransferase